jgi:hypothetical protein
MLALDEVPYVPWGEWDYPTVFRKSVKDVVQFVSLSSGKCGSHNIQRW